MEKTNTLSTQLSKWVKDARLYAGLSQEGLGEVLGRTKQNVWNMENEKHEPSYSQLMLIAEATKFPKPFPGLDRSVETIPDGYIELTYYDIQSSAGPGKFASVDYTPILDRKIWVLEDWALENFGRGAVDKIRIIDNVGDSMSPTINNGDVLFVDITQREYIADGVYIINWNGRLLTKRLRALVDGRLAIISDNKEQYETEYVTAKDIDQLVICGFVKKWWSMKG